jgi:hypothetical protein
MGPGFWRESVSQLTLTRMRRASLRPNDVRDQDLSVPATMPAATMPATGSADVSATVSAPTPAEPQPNPNADRCIAIAIIIRTAIVRVWVPIIRCVTVIVR